MFGFDPLIELRCVRRRGARGLWSSLVDISCHNVTAEPSLRGKVSEHLANRAEVGPHSLRMQSKAGAEPPVEGDDKVTFCLPESPTLPIIPLLQRSLKRGTVLGRPFDLRVRPL